MGRRIVRVPVGFKHPLDETGGEIPGAHLEILYEIDEAALTAFQIYEDVSEGTPVSPVFNTHDEMRAWLHGEGYSHQAVEAFIQMGFAPLLVGSEQGVVDGIEGLPGMKGA